MTWLGSKAPIAAAIHEAGWQENPDRMLREDYAAYLLGCPNAMRAMSYEQFKKSREGDPE